VLVALPSGSKTFYCYYSLSRRKRWLRLGDGVSVAAARYAALGYLPRQSLFTHVNELALVAGLSPALVDRALPFMTVFNGSSSVDAGIASSEVMAAFSKSGNATSPLASADPLAVQKSETPVAKSPCYRVETTIGFANGRRTASEVVIVLDDKAEPYRVLSWQDGVEPRNLPPVRRRS